MSIKAKLLVTKNSSQQSWEECTTPGLSRKALEACVLWSCKMSIGLDDYMTSEELNSLKSVSESTMIK